MEIVKYRYEQPYAFTEHAAVFDEDGARERAFRAATPTLAALLAVARGRPVHRSPAPER